MALQPPGRHGVQCFPQSAPVIRGIAGLSPLLLVVFVDRADGRRVISLRKANHREMKRYAET